MVRSALATIEPKLAPRVEEEDFKSITRFMLDPDASTAVLIDVCGDLAQYFGVQSGILIVHVPDLPACLKAADLLLSVDGRTPMTRRLFSSKERRQRRSSSDGWAHKRPWSSFRVTIERMAKIVSMSIALTSGR